MRYCARCILPSTRPQLKLDEAGVCNACRSHASKPGIDWAARAAAFADVASRAKAKSRGYDCLIPVSGGKDSTWQVVKCLEQGLNPLAVTWKTPARTALGARNLDNLVRLGVDHIDYQVNPRVEKVFMKAAFEKVGSTAVPMHMALFAIPPKIAVKFGVPLVVWGENSAFEYGQASDAHCGFALDAAWLKAYGVTHGTTARDWVSPVLTEKALTPYAGPTAEELAASGLLAVFLGYYFPWDPVETLKTARAAGFQSRAEGPKTGLYDYADIDDDFISIHHWLKWYKFGFTRLFDNLSLEIRNGRMTREQAVRTVRDTGDQTPREDIEKFCAFAGVTTAWFFETAEKFRSPAVWTREGAAWKIKDFLVPDWRWV